MTMKSKPQHPVADLKPIWDWGYQAFHAGKSRKFFGEENERTIYLRRASAYDVFAPGILAQASQVVSAQQQLSLGSSSGPTGNASRRSSFRIPTVDDPPQNDNSPSPDNASSPVLMVEEDRRMRRRGSQL